MSGFQYFVASSLDGFIATAEDNLAWLLQFDGFDGGKESYDAFMADVGCIVMGGDTYAWLTETRTRQLAVSRTRPAGCSRTTSTRAPKGADVTFVRGPVGRIRRGPQGRRGRHGTSGSSAAGSSPPSSRTPALLDEIIVSIIPVVLGSGKAVLPMAGPTPPLELLSRTPWAGASWSCATVSGAARPSALRRALRRCGAYAAMSRIRLVMRAVDSRRPCSSVMTISCVVRVRPRWMAVHVPVTVPAVMAR